MANGTLGGGGGERTVMFTTDEVAVLPRASVATAVKG